MSSQGDVSKSKAKYEGKTFESKAFGKYKVKEYVNCREIVICFEDTGYEKKVGIKEMLNGAVKDAMRPSVYGVGYIGDGEFTARFKGGGNTPCYDSWRGILRRCYSETHKKDHPTYIGCEVESNWHNYQNFAAWYYDNLIYTSGRVEVDKDLLVKGNKVYGEKFCSLVPTQINALFTGASKIHRGKYPLGVYFKKDVGKFRAQIHKGGDSQEFLGDFSSPEAAFAVYKKHKELFIKETASKYKNFISGKLFDVLMNYTVSIED
jgi:hypothetical protein